MNKNSNYDTEFKAITTRQISLILLVVIILVALLVITFYKNSLSTTKQKPKQFNQQSIIVKQTSAQKNESEKWEMSFIIHNN